MIEDRPSKELNLEPTTQTDFVVEALAPSRDMSIEEKLARINALNKLAKPRGRRRVRGNLHEVVASVTEPFNGFSHRETTAGVRGTKDILFDFAEEYGDDPEAKKLIEDIAQKRSI